jgi:hypothetical protein
MSAVADLRPCVTDTCILVTRAKGLDDSRLVTAGNCRRHPLSQRAPSMRSNQGVIGSPASTNPLPMDNQYHFSAP